MWAQARPCLSGTVPVVTGRKVEGMGTSFFVDRIRLTSHLRRPKRNPMPTCSRLYMTANRTCRLGTSVSQRKRVEMCWPLYGLSPSETVRSTWLSAGLDEEKMGGGMRPVLTLAPVAEEGMCSLVVLLLAERARFECARSTRAIEDQPGYP